MKVFLNCVLFSASVLLAQECPEMPPMECADGDILCPMGADEFGCAYPDVCMPFGSVCPVVCPHNPPSMCADGDTICPGGTDYNGCPLMDICMPNGAACPVVCFHNPPTMCADD
eukprot:UN24113